MSHKNTRWFILLILLALELAVLGSLLHHGRKPLSPDSSVAQSSVTLTPSPPSTVLLPEPGSPQSPEPISPTPEPISPTPELIPPAPEPLPEGFVRAEELIPNLVVELRYLGHDNFIGRPIAGYESNSAIMTTAAAQALKRVQTSLNESGHGLVLYDAYRPKTAVADFVTWAQDQEDQMMKTSYYPDINKANILKDGYIATRSGHSRGSTVDVSLIRLDTGDALDMGASFDFFGRESHPDWPGATIEQAANRALLRTAMEEAGFIISSIEWWHFRLKNEPFPDTWFDFPVR